MLLLASLLGNAYLIRKAGERGVRLQRSGDEIYIQRAIKLEAKRLRIPTQQVLTGRTAIAFWLNNKVCVNLRLNEGWTGSDPTYCFSGLDGRVEFFLN